MFQLSFTRNDQEINRVLFGVLLKSREEVEEEEEEEEVEEEEEEEEVEEEGKEDIVKFFLRSNFFIPRLPILLPQSPYHPSQHRHFPECLSLSPARLQEKSWMTWLG
jgi:hypothetical protein